MKAFLHMKNWKEFAQMNLRQHSLKKNIFTQSLASGNEPHMKITNFSAEMFQ